MVKNLSEIQALANYGLAGAVIAVGTYLAKYTVDKLSGILEANSKVIATNNALMEQILKYMQENR